MKILSLMLLSGGCAILLSSRIPTNLNTSGMDVEPGQRASVNRSALARVMGEFRTGTSDLLFVKTERYLHGGVGYTSHEDVLNDEGELIGTAQNASIESLIPEEQKDYRGWIGHMHRQVKPWQSGDEHSVHGSGEELIPWFRVMTLSDPHYIQGYLAGAFWIRKEDQEAALAFIEEGLAKNPEAFQLYYSRGMMRMRAYRKKYGTGFAMGDAAGQRELMEKMREDFRQAVALMLEEFPKNLSEEERALLPSWGMYKDQDAYSAAHVAIVLEKRYGDPDTAEALTHKILEIIPDHPNLPLKD